MLAAGSKSTAMPQPVLLRAVGKFNAAPPFNLRETSTILHKHNTGGNNMIRNSIDIASRVSPQLTNLIETLINDLETDEPVTLGAVRAFIAYEMPDEMSESEEMHHFDVAESVVDELDELIEGFGESAAAVDFIYAFASEQLSRVIEAVMNDENRENPPTLAAIRDAIIGGLPGRLVGEGVLEDDEDDQLLPEIENLITQFGPDAPAEEYLRYE